VVRWQGCSPEKWKPACRQRQILTLENMRYTLIVVNGSPVPRKIGTGKSVSECNHTVKNAEQIRTSVITKWLKIYNLREVQHLAGHRYISSTESYLQNDMEGLKEEVQQFHPLG